MAFKLISGLFLALALASGTSFATPAAEKTADLGARTRAAQELLDTYYGSRSNLVQAQALLDGVLKEDPKFVAAHIQAARVIIMGGHIVHYQFAGGTIEAADTILRQALELAPEDPEVFVLMGHVLKLQRKGQEAIFALEKARRLKAINPWLDNNLADVHQEFGNDILAASHFQRVVDKGPGSTAQQRRAYVHAATGLLWIASRRNDDAEVMRYGKMMVEAAPPEDAWARGNFAQVLVYQGYFEEAEANARKALSIMNYGAARNQLAFALYGRWARLASEGKAAEGEAFFAEAQRLNPDLASVVKRFRSAGGPLRPLAAQLEQRAASSLK